MLKQHLKLPDPACEVDSSSIWSWELLPEVYEHILRLFNDLSEAFSNKASLENTWGRSTHLDSMAFAWPSWDSSLRGIGSHTSWPDLLSEMSSFLMASLTSFSEYPWRSPWYHSWSLRSWSTWSSWSASSWSWLTDFSLISRMPSLRELSELSMLISNSEVACFPMILLQTCWDGPGEIDSEHSLKVSLTRIMRSLPRLTKPLTPEEDLTSEHWTTWESMSEESYLTLFFCWSGNCLNWPLRNISNESSW